MIERYFQCEFLTAGLGDKLEENQGDNLRECENIVNLCTKGNIWLRLYSFLMTPHDAIEHELSLLTLVRIPDVC